MLSVKNLYIYPVKSMQGIALSQADVLASGFEYDRVLMVSEPDGTFVTARTCPSLLKLTTTVVEEISGKKQICISLPAVTDAVQSSIIIDFDDFSPIDEPTEVWGNHFTSRIASIRVNQFLSDFLQKDIQLRWVGKTLSRRVKRYPQTPLSFADGYPYLLLNLASFHYLRQKCPEKLDIRQFRGNILIDGALPFAEDGWKTIKIGDVIFDLVKPCSRCVITTRDAETAKQLAHNEPLRTLGTFRTDERGEIDFGINMIARNQGIISIDDQIEIIERKPAKSYIPSLQSTEQSIENVPTNSQLDEKHQSYTITFGEQTFLGNNTQTILEQLEQQHIQLPYSCRAGICGRCQVTLVEGKVSAMTQSAIKRNNHILACSCIPMSNIKIEK